MARTGRLSSDQPNLHNIPVRSDEGREFRKAFVPAPGCELLVADYNQIELRCIAHLAEDPGLIDSFESGRDIHTETASRIFGVEPGDVTVEQRSKAKMVSYGLAYGMEAYGLGQRLEHPHRARPPRSSTPTSWRSRVKAYMDRTVAEARERGYTETLFGRRRPIPELLVDNFRIRQAGERQAMNAGIQGLAADIFKVALVRLDARLLEEAGADSRARSSRCTTRCSSRCRPSERRRRRRPLVAEVHGRRRRAAGAARGQPGSVGATAGPTPRAEPLAMTATRTHWFEPIADHLGRGLPPLLVHQGHRAGGRLPRRRPRPRARDAGARRRLRPGPPRPRPRRAAASRCVGVDISQRFVDLASRRRPAGRHVRSGPTPGRLAFDAEFDAAISLCQGAFGLTGGPGAPSTTTAPCSRAWPGPCGPGGRLAVSAFSSYFQVRYLEDQDTASTPSAGVNHERTEVQDEAGRGRRGRPVDHLLHAPGAAAPGRAPPGLEVEHLWSVTPGRLRAPSRPRSTRHEFLLVARRP